MSNKNGIPRSNAGKNARKKENLVSIEIYRSSVLNQLKAVILKKRKFHCWKLVAFFSAFFMIMDLNRNIQLCIASSLGVVAWPDKICCHVIQAYHSGWHSLNCLKGRFSLRKCLISF